MAKIQIVRIKEFVLFLVVTIIIFFFFYRALIASTIEYKD